jgi:hypothetical protein
MNTPLAWTGITVLSVFLLGCPAIPETTDRAAAQVLNSPDSAGDMAGNSVAVVVPDLHPAPPPTVSRNSAVAMPQTPAAADSPPQVSPGPEPAVQEQVSLRPEPAILEPPVSLEPIVPTVSVVEIQNKQAGEFSASSKGSETGGAKASTKTGAARPARNPPLDLDLLWAGSWERGGKLTNRADLKLRLKGPDLTLRAQVLDRRPGNFESLIHRLAWDTEEALSRFQGGLYHGATGSRILYGPLDEWGLAARLRNPWSRALPFTESRKASMADLRNSPSSKEPELYLYLGTPFFKLPGTERNPVPELRAFASVRLNPARLAEESVEGVPLGTGTALNVALEGRLGKKLSLGLESFYTAAALPAGKSSGWFSEKAPLPPRNFSLYGLGLLFSTNWLSLSSDLAWSRTSILGRDLYANLGLRTGNRGTGGASRPGGEWQLSLALDGAGRNYTGSDGQNPGAGFRTGGKFEWRQNRVGLFRISSVLSGPGITKNSEGDLDLSFNRSSSSLYYRPPASALPLRLSRISLGAERDARDTSLRDSAAADLSLTINPQAIARVLIGNAPDGTDPPQSALTLGLSGSLTGSPGKGWGSGEGSLELSPWPIPGGPYRLESFKTGGDIGWSFPLSLGAGAFGHILGRGRGNLRLKAGLDYSLSAPTGEDETIKESRSFSFQAALSGSRGRFSLNLNYPDFPWRDRSLSVPWDLSLSWKREW